MAGRPSSTQTLNVWMNGEFVGQWSFSHKSGHSFIYDRSWLNNSKARSISLSMPLSNGVTPFTGPVVEFYFDNLLPDTPRIRKRIASKFGADSTNAFQLLEKIGRDCVGALQFLPKDSPAPDVRRLDAEPLTETEIERILDDAVSGRNFGISEEDELRISIAGAQEKTALLWHDSKWCRPHGTTPTTHIMKLPLGEVGGMRADFSTSVENEWLCLKLLRAYGLDVPNCEVQRFGPHKVLVVERFDRRLTEGWWVRLPQEDFCQVEGVPQEKKYESKGGPGISQILNKLRGSENAELDRRNFLTAQLIFWMLAAPDGHAKNFSIFIGRQDRFRLTPFYDVMSAWPVIGRGPREFQLQKVKLSMALHTSNTHYKIVEIQRRHWNQVAQANAVGSDFEEVIHRIIEATPTAIDSVARDLDPHFPDEVSGRIFDGLNKQMERLRIT